MLTNQATAIWGNWSDPASSPTALIDIGHGAIITSIRGTSAVQTVTESGTVTATSGALSDPLYSSTVSMTRLTVGGEDYVVSTGHYFQDVVAYRIYASGVVQAPARMLGKTGLVEDLAAYSADGVQSLYTISRKTAGVSVWQGDMQAGWTKVQDFATGDWTKLGGLTAMVRVGSTLYAASADKNTVTSLSISATGKLQSAATIDATKGLLATSPSSLVAAKIADQDYLIVGANSSSSLTVVKLGPSGAMQVTDQVLDTLHTRFENVSHLRSFQIANKAYVVASGGDKGLSLFTLLPGGRLLHQSSIADTTTTTLDHITDLRPVVTAQGVDLYVTSASEAGVTKLSFTTGIAGRVSAGNGTVNGSTGDDILTAGSSGATLDGQDGDDILMDGTGTDTLRGGAGRDVFVLKKDGQIDTIVDFDPTQDRLDLSTLGRSYVHGDVGFTPHAGGITISLGDEILNVLSHDRTELNARDFTTAMLFDADHVDVSNAPKVAPDGIVADPRHGTPYTPPPDPVVTKPTDPNAQGETEGAIDPKPAGPPPPDAPIDQPWAPDQNIRGREGAQKLSTGSGTDFIFAEAQSDWDGHYSYVTRLYQAALGRTPEWNGLRNWAYQMKDGMTQLEAASGFAQSAEFKSRTGADTTDGFLHLMYQNVLGREPDPGGLQTWTKAMSDGMTRAEVLRNFANSTEFIENTRDLTTEYSWAGNRAEWSGFVFGMYQATFNRLPDPVGFPHWTEVLANTGDTQLVAQQFAASAEFQQTYGALDNRAFVELMYRNVLDRQPDGGGYDFWLGRLESGLPQYDVLHGFAGSPELAGKVRGTINKWMRDHPDDQIEPGGGDNTVFGGFLSDTFVFEARVSSDTKVLDFELWDRLKLRGFGYDSASDARAHMTQVGDDTVFDDQYVRITLQDTQLSALDDATFLF